MSAPATSLQSGKQDRDELVRFWPTLVGATGAAATGLQLFVYTSSYFLKPLEADMGWTRGQIAFGTTCATLASAALLPVVGYLTDRHGARKVGTIGLIGYGVLCLLLAAVPPVLGVFYAMLIAIGLFYTAASLVVFAPVVARRFDRRRGLALGITMSGASILLVPLAPALNALIAFGGWRAGYVMLGGLALLVGLPCLYLATRQTPFVQTGEARKAHDWAAFLEPLRTVAFWLIMGGALVGGTAVGGFLHHLAAIASDMGFSALEVGGLASLFVVMVVVGRTVMGHCLDTLKPQLVAVAVLLAAAVGAMLMHYGAGALPTAIVSVVLIGAAMGTEADIHAFFVARRFGVERFSTLFSVISMVVFVSLGLGALLFGTIYDLTGSYDLALSVAAGLFVLSGCLFGVVSLKPPEGAA